MLTDALFSLFFFAMFLVFGANLVQAVRNGSVWAKSGLIRRSEHALSFGITTLVMAFMTLSCLFMVAIGLVKILHLPI